MDNNVAVNDAKQYILLRFDNEQYGIDISYIDNIVRYLKCTHRVAVCMQCERSPLSNSLPQPSPWIVGLYSINQFRLYSTVLFGIYGYIVINYSH